MEDDKPNPESSRVLLWSCGVSALLLALFLYLQQRYGDRIPIPRSQ
jgi:hypothetical protein